MFCVPKIIIFIFCVFKVLQCMLQKNFSIQEWPLYKGLYIEKYSLCLFMFGAILKATNSSFQKGMTFCSSIYVKKVMKLLAFIFEQSSYYLNYETHRKQRQNAQAHILSRYLNSINTEADPEGGAVCPDPLKNHTNIGFPGSPEKSQSYQASIRYWAIVGRLA